LGNSPVHAATRHNAKGSKSFRVKSGRKNSALLSIRGISAQSRGPTWLKKYEISVLKSL
jgi:hypothetical protein